MMIQEKPLKDFILGAQAQLCAKINQLLSPIYDPESGLTSRVVQATSHLARKPFPAQQDVINALCAGYASGKRALALVGEMGTGKTLMGVMTSQALSVLFRRPLRSLILCPPTLISTWREEIVAIYGNKALVVDCNESDALAKFVVLRSRRKVRPDRPEFWIMGFNRAKLSYSWQSEVFKRRRGGVEHLHCGKCSAPLDEEMFGLVRNANRQVCHNCGNPLWGPDGGIRRYAPVNFIKSHLDGAFDLLLADEVHQLKGADTIQGAMLGQLASVCRKTLILTGTLSGGKASDIYYLIQRALALNMSRSQRQTLLPHYHEVQEFVRSYGTIERIYKHTREDDAKQGRKSKIYVTVKEKPGISPLALSEFFIENSVFIRISDMASSLPHLDEILEFVDLDEDLRTAYSAFQSVVRSAAMDALHRRDFTVLGQMMSNLLAWPDFPHIKAEINNRDKKVVASVNPLEPHETAKDRRLIEIMTDNRAEGRKALIFVEYTGKWGGDIEVAGTLRRAGFKVLVMKSAIPAAKRLDWIRARMAEDDYDGLICQPKLVEVGLNLLQFPEVIFYQTGFSTYTLRQASRRSYRPGQKQDVRIRYLINRGTVQETAMSLIASKLEASLVLEGELSDKGLVALSEMGDSLAVELARSLVNGVRENSLESRFSALKQIELVSNSLISEQSEPTVTTTVTTIRKGSRSESFTTRTVEVKIGEIRFVPGQPAQGELYGRDATGKVLRYPAMFSKGEISMQGRVVGSYSSDGKVIFLKSPDRDFLIRKASVEKRSGRQTWAVIERKAS